MNKIILGDCLEVMRGLDLPDNTVIITDPPYPDYYADEYKYFDGIIDFLKDLPYRQLVFWSAKVDFPLTYTAIHIWDKNQPLASYYERIFERNGKTQYKIYTGRAVQNKVAAQMQCEDWTTHPSQKPMKLMKKLILEYSKEGDIILDPFCGSGTTLKAAKDLGRNYIGIEINPDYVKIAQDRLKQEILL